MRTILLLFIVGLSVHFAPGQEVASRDDYAVYAIVAEDVRRLEKDWAGTRRNLLIIAQTIKSDEPWIGNEKTRLSRLLTTDFRRLGQQSLSLRDSFSKLCDCELLSSTELRDLLERGGSEYAKQLEHLKLQLKLVRKGAIPPVDCDAKWKYLYQKFPGVGQYYEFSRVAYSTSRNFAYVETTGTGGCSGSGFAHILSRTKTGWKIIRRDIGGRGVS